MFEMNAAAREKRHAHGYVCFLVSVAIAEDAPE
jgi:hypothetical protein